MASHIQTAPGESEESSPQRGATRAPVRKPVRLQFDDAIDVVEAMCHNVSIGGMFVHSSEGRPIGGLVRFELMLDEDSSIRGLAEVVWMRAQTRTHEEGPKSVAGMGLRFRFLEQRDRQLIFKLVSQHIKERLAARHPGLGDGQEPEPEPDAPPPIRAPASTVERVTKPAQAPLPASDELLPSIDALNDEPTDDGPSDDGPKEVGSPADTGPEAAPGTTPDAAGPTGWGTVSEDADEDESGQRSLLFRDGDEVDAGPAASEPTGAWLQEGLSEDSFENAGFGGDDPSFQSYVSPSYAASSFEDDAQPYDEPYESDLYGDDTHFEHRPKQRRDIPILTLVGLLVAVLAVSAYLWGDKLFQRGSDGDVASAPLADAALDSDPVAESPSGSTEGGDESDFPPIEAKPEPQTQSRPQTQAQSQTLPPAAQPPPERSESRRAARGGPFRTVRDISARVAGAEVEIVITTDGRVDDGRYSYSRLPSGAPRELIRLRGLTQRFSQETIPVGIGAVRQVRTGWHRKPSGNELHVVIDLANGSAKLTGLRVEGSQIIASVKG